MQWLPPSNFESAIPLAMSRMNFKDSEKQEQKCDQLHTSHRVPAGWKDTSL